MFDAKKLLDQFLGSGAQGRGKGGEFDLGGMLSGRNTGGIAGGGSGNAGLTEALGGLASGGFGKGALVGGLAGLLLGGKKPRKLAGSALKYGGLAVVGGLAYKAWRDWQAGQTPGASAQTAGGQEALPPPPADTPFSPAAGESEQRVGLALIRAMIAAAKADGHIDAEEQKRIFGQIETLDLDGEAKAFVLDELAKPLDIDSVAAAARTPEEAAEIYAASLMAIDPDDPAERGYLAMLAGRLKLDPALVEHLHANVKALG